MSLNAIDETKPEPGTMAEPNYRRVIVKVSGEALMGPDEFGIHQATLQRIVADLVAAHDLGVNIGIVIGGGNIVRGVRIAQQGISRVTADMMGNPGDNHERARG